VRGNKVLDRLCSSTLLNLPLVSLVHLARLRGVMYKRPISSKFSYFLVGACTHAYIGEAQGDTMEACVHRMLYCWTVTI
jgi:hypothetical protein